MAEGAWNADRFGSGLTAALLAVLAGGRDADGLQRAVADSAAAAEGVCDGRPMACGPGCPYCCVLNVAILLPEALVIADWLNQQLPAARLADLRARLAAHCCRARWMEDEERIFQKAACPFLDGAGNCSIHQVRPLVCRGAASFDRDSCRAAFSPLLAEEERQVPVDLLRQAAFDAAFMALAEVLRRHGLDDRSIELGTGVLAFLDHPDCRELFLAGGRLSHAFWEA